MYILVSNSLVTLLFFEKRRQTFLNRLNTFFPLCYISIPPEITENLSVF